MPLFCCRPARAGALPPPPQTFGGKSFEIQFEGLLAQSQKSVDLNPTNQFISALQSLSASIPDVIDRIDPDGLVDVYAHRFSIDRHLLRDKSAADNIRQQRAEQLQQQQSLAAGESMASSMNSLAQAQKAGADASMASQNLDLSSIIGGM